MHVNVEQRDLFGGLDRLDLRFCGTIPVLMHLAPFDKALVIDHLLEFLLRDEEIVDAVLFTFAGCPGRVGDAEAKLIFVCFGQCIDQGSFASA